MTPRCKNQHYVSRFQLREFRIPGTSIEHAQVWCFDKREERSFPVAVEKVCAEGAFYDLDGDQVVDQVLTDLENKLSPCLRALIDARNVSRLTTDERAGVAVLIATQHLRTRAFRNTIREAARLAANAAQSKGDGTVPSDLSEEDPAKRFQVYLMDRANAFAESLLRMKWILLVNETQSPFWYSDNPFTLSNVLPFDPHDGQGFERPGSQTHFPLNPSLVLSIVDPRCYPQYPTVVPVRELKNVIFNNHLQVKSAERFLFSRDDEFALARRMIANRPSLRDQSQRFSHLDMRRLRR